MLDQVLYFFNIEPDIDLDIMLPNQALTSLTSPLLLGMDEVLLAENPDLVLAQWNTTTAMAVSLACFYRRIPTGYIEAGLRTWDMQNPFPEEVNRETTGKLSRWHFAPTDVACKSLLREGVQHKVITITGYTVYDALLKIAATKREMAVEVDARKRLVLITAHRRENFGEPILNICFAMLCISLHCASIAECNDDVLFLYPVHPNPNVKGIVHETLGSTENIILCKPLDYPDFVAAMKQSFLIISDSGGVQEEAPALGKPVLVLREETERPEAVEACVVKLVGSNHNKVVLETQKLLDDPTAYNEMARGISPYGDGQASSRIVTVLREHFV